MHIQYFHDECFGKHGILVQPFGQITRPDSDNMLQADGFGQQGCSTKLLLGLTQCCWQPIGNSNGRHKQRLRLSRFHRLGGHHRQGGLALGVRRILSSLLIWLHILQQCAKASPKPDIHQSIPSQRRGTAGSVRNSPVFDRNASL